MARRYSARERARLGVHWQVLWHVRGVLLQLESEQRLLLMLDDLGRCRFLSEPHRRCDRCVGSCPSLLSQICP